MTSNLDFDQITHSTVFAVLSIIDKIQKAIENGNFSCGIFLDLSTTFDTVNHQILLQKLEYYGIRGITNDWSKSYLYNRKQLVSLGSFKSDILYVSCGLPKGSVLGPILFLLYVNDFHKFSNILVFHLFADNSNIFLCDKNFSKLVSTRSIINKSSVLASCVLASHLASC